MRRLWIPMVVGLFFSLAALIVFKQVSAHQALAITPPAIASYLYNGSAWVPNTNASGFQASSTTPPAQGMYCYSGSAWTPCLGGGGTGTFTTVTANSYLTPIGASVASATTITPTGMIFHITGTNTIQTITLPSGMGPTIGGCLQVIADAAWATNTSGNVADVVNASPNTIYQGCYDGNKWFIK